MSREPTRSWNSPAYGGANHSDDPLAEYDYLLPEDLIAQHPAEPRDSCRLMVLDRSSEGLQHARFSDLPEFLKPGDLLVFNDTKVLPVRLKGHKVPGGGSSEVFLLEPFAEPGVWEALIRVPGRARPGLEIRLEGGWLARLVAPMPERTWRVRLEGQGPVEEFLDRHGHVPLPPYIKRPERPEDKQWYQTVFARRSGAVAAPTAGLHFTEDLIQRLRAGKVEIAYVTLHVGVGTFRPLASEDLARGRLHWERFELDREAAGAVGRTRECGGRVVAVGTTVARVLETCGIPGGLVEPREGVTDLFIRPPYRPKVVDGLITNFHLPRSSLIMLVAAFAGRRRIMEAYAEAVRLRYRFYSYGDAMLIL